MGKKKPIKIAISGGDSWVNTGDEAILSGTLQLFNNLNSNIIIKIISGDREKTQTQFPKYDVINRKNLLEYISSISDIDIFIWGGGHLIQNTSSKLFLVYQFFLVMIPLMWNKKVIGFCLGAEIINGKFWQWLTRMVLNHFDLISVRDRFSFNVLKNLRIFAPVILSADPAVVLASEGQADSLIKESFQKPFVLISPRKWFDYRSSFFPVKYRRKIHKSEDKRFLDSLDVFRKTCDWLIEKYGFHVYFLPMYIKNEQNDNDVAKRIRKGMTQQSMAHVINNQLPPKTLIRIMKDAELLIGMRMHSTILGACAGIPIIGLYYQRKGRSFFETLDIHNYMLPIEEINLDAISAMTEKVLSSKKSIIMKIQKNLAVQKKLVQMTVNKINDQFIQNRDD